MHYRCNQVYVPWVNKGGRRTDTLRNIVSKWVAQTDLIICLISICNFKHDKKLVRHKRVFSVDYSILRKILIIVIFGNFDTLLQVPVIQFSVEAAATKSLVVPVNEGGLTPGVPKLRQHPTLSIVPESAGNWVGSSDTPLKYMVSPRPMYCTGRCREDFEGRADLRADVVCDKHSPRHPHPHSILDIYIGYKRRSTFLGGSSWGFND